MLLLSKVFSQLILPPGGLILLGFTGLIFWKKLWGRILIGLALILFWLISTEPVRDLLTSSLECQYPPLNVEHHSTTHAAIVLLGGGVHQDSLDYQGRDELSSYAMMRTIYAANIAKQTDWDVYATGGTPLTQDAEAEGSIMQRWLVWFGIKKSRIHTEEYANTTWENAVLTKKILSNQGINTIVLVTSAWHMPRSVWCFEQQGLKVIAAPTDYVTKQDPYDLRSFFPRWDALNDSGNAMHEYLGYFWYQLRYTNP